MSKRKLVSVLLSALLMCTVFQVQAAKWSDSTATRDYYNAAAQLPWDK